MYDVITKINNKIISRVPFEGTIEETEPRIVKPNKAMDKDYYYFILDGNPVKAKPTDVMTIDAINV